MDDIQAPPIGSEGTVVHVDDTGSICVRWDTGSGLNVIYGVDRCVKIWGGFGCLFFVWNDNTVFFLYLSILKRLVLQAVFSSVPSMALILLVKVQSRVFTAKCSEPQVGTSNGMDEGSGVTKFLSLRTETW